MAARKLTPEQRTEKARVLWIALATAAISLALASWAIGDVAAPDRSEAWLLFAGVSILVAVPAAILTFRSSHTPGSTSEQRRASHRRIVPFLPGITGVGAVIGSQGPDAIVWAAFAFFFGLAGGALAGAALGLVSERVAARQR